MNETTNHVVARKTVLVCGASGFIGAAICRRLERAGHEVVRGVRTPVSDRDIAIDFSGDITVAAWLPRLAGIDVVINAVGIIVESAHARFDDLHHRAPSALFQACAQAGVRHVVQISALGAAQGDTPYFRSKHAADEALRALPAEAVAWQILYPSLVYGDEGTSAAMFRTLASLPVVPVPALPDARFRPIHIDDLVAAVEVAIDPATPPGQTLPCVGGSEVSYRDMLDHYRRGMGLPSAHWLTAPAPLMAMAAALGRFVPGAALTPDNWRMLQAGCTGDATAITAWLGRPPRPVDQFIAPAQAESLRLRAVATWRPPLLRAVMAIVWIATAVITLFVYPMEDSLALLGATGIHGMPATVALYGAAGLDMAMGVACLLYPRRALWAAQAALILGYSAIIAVTMPQFLAHPFGPVLKNLPILAILLILYMEPESWNTSPSR